MNAPVDHLNVVDGDDGQIMAFRVQVRERVEIREYEFWREALDFLICRNVSRHDERHRLHVVDNRSADVHSAVCVLDFQSADLNNIEVFGEKLTRTARRGDFHRVTGADQVLYRNF